MTDLVDCVALGALGFGLVVTLSAYIADAQAWLRSRPFYVVRSISFPGEYLQPSGNIGPFRTARRFASAEKARACVNGYRRIVRVRRAMRANASGRVRPVRLLKVVK